MKIMKWYHSINLHLPYGYRYLSLTVAFAIVTITTLTLMNAILVVSAQIAAPSLQNLNNKTDSVDNDSDVPMPHERSCINQAVSTPTVKIINPQKGQQVPIGELTVNGISSDTAESDCDVLVILNDIKPYQPVSPTGSNETLTPIDGSPGNTINDGYGVNDYSTWTYTFTSQYALIKEGANKITSKIACQTGEGDPSVSSILKHYSVNVTGFDNNNTTSSSSLSPQNTSGTLNADINSSDMLSNATVFVVPVPNDLLPQLSNLDGNEVGDLNDNLGGDKNNSPEENDDSNEDDNSGQDNNGKGKGKAKGHDKSKS